MNNLNAHVINALDIVFNSLEQLKPDVYLFGSRAKGTETTHSDIDIAVTADVELPINQLSYIREQLENSDIPYTVDLVDMHKVDEAFKQKILTEGFLWKGSKKD